MNHLSCRLVWLSIGFWAMVLLGCASTPPTRLFTLSSLSDSGKMGSAEVKRCLSIGIGPVKIPGYVDQPEIVTRIAPNELRADEFAKWAEPIEENISRVLAENLSSLLCIRSIAIFPWKGQTPMDYRLDVQVIRMDGMLGESALLDVSWSIADGADRKKAALLTRRSRYKEHAEGGDYGSFVSAQSRNIAFLSREIAESILALSK